MGITLSRDDNDNPHTAPASPRPPLPEERNSRRVGHIRATISFYSGVRQLQEIVTTTANIGPNGGFFYGSANPPAALIEDLAEVFANPPVDTPLRDSKAHQLLVTHCNGWYAIPSPVNFSRHAGTCLLLGDRSNPSISYSVKLGDCFRLGSVGLVVVAMRLAGGKEQIIHPTQLTCIQEENLYFPDDDDEAFRFVDEKLKNKGPNQSVRTLHSADDEGEENPADEEIPLCYMCYDTHNEENNPLVAPCDCKGDTRYLHVSCLQRWYANLGCGPYAVVIRTTANGAPACKICGSAYKTTFRDSSGRKSNIVEASHTGPYISFMVITRHENAPQLFNTKFRLNFRDDSIMQTRFSEVAPYPTEMTIGRSSACNMVLDYRTVSTMHAKLKYQTQDVSEGGKGAFILEDLHSSNGSLLYLQRPLLLGSVGNRTILRLGRTTMCLDVRGSNLGSGPSALGALSCISCKSVDETFEPCAATPEELHTIMSLSSGSNRLASTPKKGIVGPTLTTLHDQCPLVAPVQGSHEAHIDQFNETSNENSAGEEKNVGTDELLPVAESTSQQYISEVIIDDVKVVDHLLEVGESPSTADDGKQTDENVHVTRGTNNDQGTYEMYQDHAYDSAVALISAALIRGVASASEKVNIEKYDRVDGK